MTLTTLDYIIFVLIMVGGIWGAIKGFIDEVSQKFGYVAGFIVATMFTISLSGIFKEKLNLPPWFSAFLAYVILFLVGFLLIKALGSILESIFDTAKLNGLNNVLGLFLGFAESLLLIGLIETALSLQNLFNLKVLFENSWVSSKVILPLFKSILNGVHGLL